MLLSESNETTNDVYSVLNGAFHISHQPIQGIDYAITWTFILWKSIFFTKKKNNNKSSKLTLWRPYTNVICDSNICVIFLWVMKKRRTREEKNEVAKKKLDSEWVREITNNNKKNANEIILITSEWRAQKWLHITHTLP